MKSEPDECSIDDALAALPAGVPWTGVRNYQARNFMRDMRIGDTVFFYHSSCPEPGIAGLATAVSTTYPDPTQFDPASPYHDPKSLQTAPRWLAIDVRADAACELISLPRLREHPAIAAMTVLRRGNRLSVMPVSEPDARYILEHLFLPTKRAVTRRSRAT